MSGKYQPTRKDQVLLFLEASGENALSGRMLAQLADCNERDIRDDVRALRLEGKPVCSGNQGYWLGSPEELLRCARRLRAHAIKEMQDGSRMMWAARTANQQKIAEGGGA